MLPIQASCYCVWEAVDDGSGPWALATYMGDLDGILGSWVQASSALGATGIWGWKWMKVTLLHLLFKQI